LLLFDLIAVNARNIKLAKLNTIPVPKKIMIPVTIGGKVEGMKLFICYSYLEIENLKLLLQ